MKKYLLIAFIFISLDTNAQNYLINFAGTGASSTVTSVKVENLTSGVNCVINGNDILSISNVLTSINGIEKDPSIETKIYPNPMIDYSTFVVFPRVSGTAFLSVFDMTGKLVSKVKYFFNDSPQQFRLSGFRSGVYLITVDGSNYRYSTKLISYGNANGVIRIEQLFSKQELEFEKVKKSSKGAMDAVRFEYNPGDMLKFTGTSGIYSTVKTLVPTKDETITFNFIPCTDANSNNYPIVEIGDQIWMGTDLRATKFNDGTIITNITDEAEWQGLITPAYCWLHNYINSTVGGGALYTFYVVAYQDKDICPVGWHVPTNDEWNILANYLGSDIAGGKLKERGTDLWLSPNTGADNSTGFTAYPDGSRYNNGLFYDSGWRNSYWTSTSSSGSGIGRRLVAYSSNIETFYSPKNFGSHIRCVNGVISIPKLTTSLITDIFYTSATAGGNVTSDGGSFISEEGICISTSSNPTTSDSKIILNYHTIGVFTIPITNLVQNTTYYVRAYATNKVGTAYGEQISFKTLPSYGLDVTTAPISFSSQIGATGGGSVASDGAAVITERGICISVNPNPVISDRKIVTSGSIGSFDSDITGLTANTTYYVRAFATNTLGTTYGREVFFSTKGESGTITDIEGNIYSTIEIGAQIWMTENLRTTKYSDGSSIPNVTDDDTWGAQTSGSFCWYNNDISNKNVYGGLYNHFAVTDLRHLCPTGWHIPSSEEWKNMSSYIEGSNWWSIIPPVTNGEKLRETGTVHWDAPNSGASNTSGFTAVPGGFRTSDGYFVGKGMVGEYWFDFSYSDDPYDLSQIFSVSQGLLQMPYAYNIDGHSVRCISDNIPLPISITTSASSITSFGATLNGQINPENQTVNAIFEYGLTNTYGNSIMANPNSLAGNTISYVNANISGLTSGSTYHYRLKLVYSGGTIFGNDMTFTLPIKVTDIDNNSYNVAIVGKRVWMVEDLRTFKYSDGSPISGVYQYNDFFNQGVPSNNWLYTWSAAMKGASSSSTNPSDVQGVCPTGWHIPSQSEWTQLINDLGGESIAGGKLKEAGYSHWESPNAGATNESGFTALPGGYRSLGGYFFRAGSEGNYWTSTEYDATNARNISLYSLYTNALNPYNSKLLGFSVRCLMNLTETYTYPVLSTKNITNITNSSASSGGIIIGNQGSPIIARGVCYSTSPLPTIDGNKTIDGLTGNSYTSILSGLQLNTTYYLRAYATNSYGTGYGEEFHFTTGQNVLIPTVSTLTQSKITSTGCWSGGIILNDGGSTIISRGVCWSTTENPTITNNHTDDGSGTGSFLSFITGLVQNSTYYVRAYAINSVGISYGGQVSFLSIGLPTLTTTAASSITRTSASSGGNITNDGGSPVTFRGICWSTSPNPSITSNTISNGTGSGAFISSITGLTANTLYYIRAFATNIVGTSYGNELSFTTTDVPTLTTNTVTSITQISAIGGGNIISDGGLAVTARGVCWSTSQNPTISNNKTTNGSGAGSFTSSLTELIAGTIYYIRAYASNSNGTSYGDQLSFTTSAATLPTVTISSASSITTSTAFIQGVVTANGGSTVTECGIYYGTSSNPQTTGIKVALGSGSIAFSTILSSLTSNVKYYVIAYAKNIVGTSYSTVINFTTLPTTPTISLVSASATNVTCYGNLCYGNVNITVQVSNYTGISSIYCSPSVPLTSSGNGIYTFSSSYTSFVKDVMPPYEYTVVIDVQGLPFDSIDIDLY